MGKSKCVDRALNKYVDRALKANGWVIVHKALNKSKYVDRAQATTTSDV